MMNKITFDEYKLYCPTPDNLYFDNPICPGDELCYGYGYDKEMFYLIDFYDIQKNTYIISSYGRLFNIVTKTRRNTYSRHLEYDRAALNVNGKDKSFSIHRLVTMAFIPKDITDIYNNRDFVNHKNSIKKDNYYKNLEWCSSQENSKHAVDMGLRAGRIQIIEFIGGKDKKTFGDNRITDEQVHIICKGIVDGLSNVECCNLAGMDFNDHNSSIICNIKAGRRRQNIARQYGITAEEKRTKTLDDKSRFVIPVCELLVKGHTIKEITQILPIDENYDRARMFVSGIKNRKYFKEISKDYIF